jgi:hypothetical protein
LAGMMSILDSIADRSSHRPWPSPFQVSASSFPSPFSIYFVSPPFRWSGLRFSSFFGCSKRDFGGKRDAYLVALGYTQVPSSRSRAHSYLLVRNRYLPSHENRWHHQRIRWLPALPFSSDCKTGGIMRAVHSWVKERI